MSVLLSELTVDKVRITYITIFYEYTSFIYLEIHLKDSDKLIESNNIISIQPTYINQFNFR